ncbi:hypothetical protein B0H10DRAFT_1956039 [Mycena sp. CBHHK59/15]|nr:hypothetical protein B0H10DRAFT_1956039 [Mycena sp. CBHHK59/15]
MTLPTFGFSSTADEVATVFASEISGKNGALRDAVLITGTSLNGIGFEAARVLAQHANLVVITGYNTERLALSEAAIKLENPRATVRPLVLDLASLASVRRAAAEVAAYPEPIHVLIHNAASGGGPFTLTADGHELQMATALFGPFLLTKLLLPKFLSSASAAPAWTPRVVFVASAAHTYGAGVDFAVLAAPRAETHTSVGAYYASKSAQILFAAELARRACGNIRAYSLHPGLVHTNIQEKSRADLQQLGVLNADGKPITNTNLPWKTHAQGAATTITAAFDPRLHDQNGAYLDDCTIATVSVAPHSSDPAIAKRLWDTTEQILGEPFTV